MVASTAFWLLVPSLLLHRKIGLRALLPGALLASVVLGGTIATSPLFLAAPLNQNGKAFGSFGVVLTVVGYVFIMITISLVCAVFSPVWIKWRETERWRQEGSGGDGESLVVPGRGAGGDRARAERLSPARRSARSLGRMDAFRAACRSSCRP